MENCQSICKNGNPCKNKGKYEHEGKHVCGVHKPKNIKISSTITITFGDQAENHVGMQKIGKQIENGFTYEELKKAYDKFTKIGKECELIRLNDFVESEESTDEAYILIIRNAIENHEDLLQEQNKLEVDKEFYSRRHGKVVNKHARHNLCISDFSQEPDYENKKGRVVDFKDVPLINIVRAMLPEFLGDKADSLQAEGNYYYDVTKCGIGFHGDAERRIVIALRLGTSFPLHYQWFYKTKPVGERVELMFNSGDMYVMSEKATGFDWKKRNTYTLRHAAGCKKYLTIKEKK